MRPNEKVREDGVTGQSLFIPGDPSKSASALWVPIARCPGIKSGLGLGPLASAWFRMDSMKGGSFNVSGLK